VKGEKGEGKNQRSEIRNQRSEVSGQKKNKKLPFFIVTIYGCTIFACRTYNPNDNNNKNQNKY
jgi:hypothetical protein